jgi:hypothetical protein
VPDLKNVLAKIKRAKEHFEALDCEIEALNKNSPVRVRQYEDTEQSLYIVRVDIPIPPQRLGIIAGDGIYDLRAALDHLAWQLALTRKERPFYRTEFPVIDRDTPDGQSYFRRVTQDIPAGACVRIKAFQPYRRGAAFKSDPLWQLDKLRNIDAHRIIPMHAITAGVKAPAAANARVQLFDDHAIVTMPIAFKPQMQLAPPSTAEVIFGSEADGIVITAQGLREIYEYVTNRVVPRFARFFPQPPKT